MESLELNRRSSGRLPGRRLPDRAQQSPTPITLPDAPTHAPATDPKTTPSAPPERKPAPDPFNPPWPVHRPEPQPKA